MLRPPLFRPAALAECGDLVAGAVVGFFVAPCSFVRAACLMPPAHCPTHRPDWRTVNPRRWLRFPGLPWPWPGLPLSSAPDPNTPALYL
jgi:hypothetical protein